ncbi:MAG: hypothetical protein H3C52_12305 [Anaerolineales bacterium]|nr:hypothetical protein [Anaerolineales bacterium]MCZ2287821.1 hypothetical protein [Anaerolineales bacterium]
MSHYLVTILNHLVCSESSQAELKDRLLAASTREHVASLLEEIKARINLCLETQSKEDEYFYYFLRAYGHYVIGDIHQAISSATHALDGFRICGCSWEQVIGRWLLSAFHAFQNRSHSSLAEMNLALDILESIRQDFLTRGVYDEVEKCQKVKSTMEEHKNEFLKKMEAISQPVSGNSRPIHIHAPVSSDPAAKEKGKLLIPWIPKHKTMRDGVNGLTEFRAIDEFPFVTIVEIDKKPYYIHSLCGSSLTDRNVTLVRGEDYGWVLMRGHGMNLCYPVPIPDGCYVLFWDYNVPKDNNIVVSSEPSLDGDFAYTVRRYRAAGQELVSETTETGSEYSPIKLDKSRQILGIVIAVAKPESP